MPGVIIFDPNRNEVGLSTALDQAAGVYLDIEDDALYFTDTVNIYKWEGNPAAKQQATWRSGKVRMRQKMNMGAVLVEADSYTSLVFNLYADGVLITALSIPNGDPIRLPGGYLSNLYEIEIITSDTITGVTVGQSIFDLAAG